MDFPSTLSCRGHRSRDDIHQIVHRGGHRRQDQGIVPLTFIEVVVIARGETSFSQVIRRRASTDEGWIVTEDVKIVIMSAAHLVHR